MTRRSRLNPVLTAADAAPVVSGLDGAFSGSNSQMSAARLALAAARTGSTMRIAIPGDSQTFGYSADAAPAGGLTKETGGWPAILRQMFAAYAGIPSGYGICATGSTQVSGSFKRSFWTLGSGWTVQSGFGWIVGAVGGAASAAGNLDFGPHTCDGFKIRWLRRSTTSTFEWWVDGGAHTSTGGSGADQVQTTTITGLTMGSHTLHLGVVGAGAAGCIILDIEPTVSTGNVAISDIAIPGSQTNQWYTATQIYNPMSLLPTWAPHLTLVMLGTNDYLTANNIVVSDLTFRYNAILTAAKTTGSVLAIIQPERTADGTTQPVGWAAYAEAEIAVAQALKVPVLDLRKIFGGPTATAMGGSVDVDGVHGNKEWHYQVARAVYRAVMAA